MLNHTLKIDTADDLKAIGQECDTITLHKFAIGDTVVKCGRCSIVMMVDTVQTASGTPTCPHCKEALRTTPISVVPSPRLDIKHRPVVVGTASGNRTGAQVVLHPATNPTMTVRQHAEAQHETERESRPSRLLSLVRGLRVAMLCLSAALMLYAGISLALHSTQAKGAALADATSYFGTRAAVVLAPIHEGMRAVGQSVTDIVTQAERLFE